ncbi:hypothetical protein LDENG_00190260 [Lucifuga dentata]|nr:hypothetical protein LDENG_00190260 [Lucifuga dentata]
MVPLSRDRSSSSSSHEPEGTQHQEHSYNQQHRKCFPELISACRRAGVHADGTGTLEFFIDRSAEPTFSQEKNNLHVVEVTQRFFETVSDQLERWYERKIVQAEQQAELRAQHDKTELLQRISTLEEELQQLKTNENADN